MPRICLLLLLGLAAADAAAATYYVSNGGSNAANGLSPATAWQTLQHAADAVGPGDVVVALPGSYVGFNLFTSGQPGAPITFTANPGSAAPNPAVVVNGNNSFTNKDRINLEGASYVVVEGFTVIGTGNPLTNRTGIRTVGFPDALAAHVTIRHNRIDNCGKWAILSGHVDDLLIEGNECSHSVDEHGIYASNSGDRPVIRDNHVWGNRANGIHMNGDLSEGNDGVISQALVERNVIHGNGVGGGSGINCDGVRDSVIRNNLIYDQHASGISLYQIDGGAPSTGNTVVCNTIHIASDGRWALNIQDGAVNTIARDNVLVNDHPTRGAIDLSASSLPGFVSDYNAVKDKFSFDDTFITFAQWKVQTGQDGHSFVATPAALFQAHAAGNYQLQAGSPAIDAGTAASAPSDDLLGKHRPALLGFDIGAYEYGACAGAVAAYGGGKGGSGGFQPQLAAAGCPDVGLALTLNVTGGLGGAGGLLFSGPAAANIPAYGGTLLTSPAFVLPHALGGAAGVPGAGVLALPVAVPAQPGLAGAVSYLQAWYADPGASFGVSMTAGLWIEVGG